MADYREINGLAKNPERVQRLAKFLLALPEIKWTSWELDFLEPRVRQADDLSTRQAEKLVELRSNAVKYRAVSGFNLADLADKCWRGRFDLADEGDIGFVTEIKESGQIRLTKPQALLLKHCAEELGLVEAHAAWEFPVPVAWKA